MSSIPLEILEYLAIESPEGASGYEIYLDLRPRRSRSSIYDHLKYLKQAGLIKEGKEGKVPTVLGLARLLKHWSLCRRGGGLLSRVEKLMNAHPEFLTPISTKWEIFKRFEQEGTLNLLIFLMCSALQFYPVENLRPLTEEGESRVQMHILDEVFSPRIFGAHELPMRLRRSWFETMNSDPDLFDLIVQRSKRGENFHRRGLYRDMFIRETLEQKDTHTLLYLAEGSSMAFIHPKLAKNCKLPMVKKEIQKLEKMLDTTGDER